MDTARKRGRVSTAGIDSVGRGLLLLGFAWSGWLALSPKGGVIHPHATVVWLCLALMLLAWRGVLRGRGRPGGAVGLVAGGAVVYALGCVGQMGAASMAGLLPAGSLLAMAGVAREVLAGDRRRHLGLGLTIVLGLGLDTLLTGALLLPSALQVAGYGTPHELPQRLLRLARVAAMVLPLIALALQELGHRAAERGLRPPGRAGRVCEWLIRGAAVGAVGMPLLLIAAAVVDPRWKYLLPLTADLVLAGTCTGAWLAWRLGDRWQLLGWSLAAASMLAGMGIGGYAFDGPLPSPVGTYTDRVRTLMREVHSGVIVVGLALVLGRLRPDTTAPDAANPEVEGRPVHV